MKDLLGELLADLRDDLIKGLASVLVVVFAGDNTRNLRVVRGSAV